MNEKNLVLVSPGRVNDDSGVVVSWPTVQVNIGEVFGNFIGLTLINILVRNNFQTKIVIRGRKIFMGDRNLFFGNKVFHPDTF